MSDNQWGTTNTPDGRNDDVTIDIPGTDRDDSPSDATVGGVGHGKSGTEGEPRRRASRRRGGAPRARGPLSKIQAARALNVIDSVRGAGDDVIAVAAAISGLEPDPDAIAIAVLTGKVESSSAVTDLADIQAADPDEAGVIAAMLGRPRLKALWTLLHAVGAVEAVEAPTSDVKAALAVARAIRERGDADSGAFTEARSILEG